MAEEKFDESTTDDQRVLNILLHAVRGLRAVSTPPLMPIEVEADDSRTTD